MTAARAKGVSIWTEARFLAAVAAAPSTTTTGATSATAAAAVATAPAAPAAAAATAAAPTPSTSDLGGGDNQRTGDLGPLADGESKEVPGSG